MVATTHYSHPTARHPSLSRHPNHLHPHSPLLSLEMVAATHKSAEGTAFVFTFSSQLTGSGYVPAKMTLNLVTKLAPPTTDTPPVSGLRVD